MRKAAILITLSTLAGCGAAHDGRYTGPGPACGPASTATLVRQGNQVVLTPTDGSIALHGTVGPTGAVSVAWSAASAKQPAKAGGKPPMTEVATGTIDAAGAHLRYVTLGCDVPLELTRPDG